MNDLIIVNGAEISVAQHVLDDIVRLERIINEAKEAQERYKEALLREMEDKCVYKFETDKIAFTYIAETQRDTFDSKAFKKDNPKLWEQYIKTSTVRPSVRVKLK